MRKPKITVQQQQTTLPAEDPEAKSRRETEAKAASEDRMSSIQAILRRRMREMTQRYGVASPGSGGGGAGSGSSGSGAAAVGAVSSGYAQGVPQEILDQARYDLYMSLYGGTLAQGR